VDPIRRLVPPVAGLDFSPLVAILGQSYRLFDVGGAVGIAGMMLMLIVAAIRHTIALYRAEPLP